MDLQALIDVAAPGDLVKAPAGSYQIDAINAPLRLKSDITLDLSVAVLNAIPVMSATPSGELGYHMVEIHGCNNVTIIGGTIVGERDKHLSGTAPEVGGFGHGISIQKGSRNIKVQNTKVSACFADGIYIEDAFSVEIARVTSDRNRRQGMSVIQVDGLVVDSCQFSNTGGTPPGDGVDCECDIDAQSIRNVQISRCVFVGNVGAGVAFGSPGTYANCRVTPDNSFDMHTQPIWAGGNAAPLGTPLWAFLLNRSLGWTPGYRWWLSDELVSKMTEAASTPPLPQALLCHAMPSHALPSSALLRHAAFQNHNRRKIP